ncbi:MAG: hypothetical protein AAF242_01460 [Bacteroidota bacterium]
MTRHHLLVFGLFLSFCQIVVAQSTASNAKVFSSDSIPFKVTSHNNLVIKAILNQEDTLNLMFHTAASGVTLIEEASKRINTVKWQEGDKVQSWGGAQDARVSPLNTLQIGQFSWDSVTIWENAYSGPETDGKFGPHLFEGWIMELNFDLGLLVLHQELPDMAAYEKVPLILENGFLFMKGVSTLEGQDFPNQFLIHSGYGGTLLYDDGFVEESQIGKRIPITDQKELKDSYGNVIKTLKGALPKLSLGALEFSDLPVGFFEGSIGRQKMSVLGGDLLKRMNLIFDVEKEALYLKPSKWKGSGFKDS